MYLRLLNPVRERPFNFKIKKKRHCTSGCPRLAVRCECRSAWGSVRLIGAPHHSLRKTWNHSAPECDFSDLTRAPEFAIHTRERPVSLNIHWRDGSRPRGIRLQLCLRRPPLVPWTCAELRISSLRPSTFAAYLFTILARRPLAMPSWSSPSPKFLLLGKRCESLEQCRLTGYDRLRRNRMSMPLS